MKRPVVDRQLTLPPMDVREGELDATRSHLDMSFPTTKGKRLIPKITKHSKKTNKKFLMGLTSTEIDAVRAIILKMLANSEAPPKHI